MPFPSQPIGDVREKAEMTLGSAGLAARATSYSPPSLNNLRIVVIR